MSHRYFRGDSNDQKNKEIQNDVQSINELNRLNHHFAQKSINDLNHKRLDCTKELEDVVKNNGEGIFVKVPTQKKSDCRITYEKTLRAYIPNFSIDTIAKYKKIYLDSITKENSQYVKPQQVSSIIRGKSPRYHRGVVKIVREDGYMCTGFMVSKYIIVTSAHCFDKGEGADYFTGSIKYFDPDIEAERTLSSGNSISFLIHPDYSSGDVGNDIAILAWTKTWPETDSQDYLFLNDNGMEYMKHTKVAGAGNKSDAGDEDRNLSKAYVGKVDVYSKQLEFKTSSSTKPKLCTGDSGGPWIWNDESEANKIVTGVTSAIITSGTYWNGWIWVYRESNNCTVPDGKNFATKINRKVDWIKEWHNYIDNTHGDGDERCQTTSYQGKQVVRCF